MEREIAKVSKFEIFFFKSLGIIITLLGMFMYIAPMFWDVKRDYTKDGWYIPSLIMIFGIVVFLYYRKIGFIVLNYAESKLLDENEKEKIK